MAMLVAIFLAVQIDPASVWNALMREGDRCWQLGEYPGAERHLRQALRQAADERSQAVSLNNLGAVCAEEGKYREAESIYLRGLDMWRRIEGADPLTIAVALSNLAGTSANQKQPSRADMYYKQAIEILDK